MIKHAPKGRIKAREGVVNPMADSDPMAGKCSATNRKGNRCTQPHIPGGTVCRYHGGAAPQVRQKALERLTAYQDRAIDRLCQLVEQQDYPSTAYAAVRDVLDRTMGKPAESVSLQVTGEVNIVTILRGRHERTIAEKANEKLLPSQAG